jgi:hypothetical protein
MRQRGLADRPPYAADLSGQAVAESGQVVGLVEGRAQVTDGLANRRLGGVRLALVAEHVGLASSVRAADMFPPTESPDTTIREASS